MMTTKSLVRLASVAGLLAVAFMTATVFASSAHAQTSPPATMYGTAKASDKVETLIDGKVCTKATAGADGFWQTQIPDGGTCGAAAGKTINFTLNGAPASQTETWQPGGAPKVVASGVALTAGGPVPPKTGNAGLLPSGGVSSPWFALMLGAFALAGLAGARAMTGRRS